MTAIIVIGSVLGYLALVRGTYSVLTRLNFPCVWNVEYYCGFAVSRRKSAGQDYDLSRAWRWLIAAFAFLTVPAAVVAGAGYGIYRLLTFREPVTPAETALAREVRRKALQLEIATLEHEAEILRKEAG